MSTQVKAVPMGERGMSKQRNEREPSKPLPPLVVVPVVATPIVKVIEEYRRCPICWGGNGGYGNCYSTQGRTRYYKCCQTTKPESGPCGHTWTATVLLETIKIEHRRVILDGER